MCTLASVRSHVRTFDLQFQVGTEASQYRLQIVAHDLELVTPKQSANKCGGDTLGVIGSECEIVRGVLTVVSLPRDGQTRELHQMPIAVVVVPPEARCTAVVCEGQEDARLLGRSGRRCKESIQCRGVQTLSILSYIYSLAMISGHTCEQATYTERSEAARHSPTWESWICHHSKREVTLLLLLMWWHLLKSYWYYHCWGWCWCWSKWQ